MVRRNFKKDRGKILSKFRSNRHSVFKPKNRKKPKRKFENDSSNQESAKKQKTYQNIDESSSDDSQEEIEDPLKKLLHTFNLKDASNKILAVESEDSETNDEEIEDENDESCENCDEISQSDLSEIEERILEENESSEDISESDDINIKEEMEQANEKEETEDLTLSDPFVNHLCYDLSDEFVDCLQNACIKKVVNLEWAILGKLSVSTPNYEPKKTQTNNFTIVEDKKLAQTGKVPIKNNLKNLNLIDMAIKSQISKNIKPANKTLPADESCIFTNLQNELFSIINNYQDFYYPERTLENGEEIRFTYSLHALNHILKTRTKVLHHNAHLKNKKDVIVPEEYRDQGLVRPKVLVIVPFRDSALRIVQMMIDILVPNDKGQVFNKQRFMEDFSGGELLFPKKNPKPEDYENTFAGNCDDTFKIGIQITKKSIKLYADFYSSDIIIASPLGLRLTVGAEGEAERDHDFLSSIELLILDQTEIFLMQNWDHLTHVLAHLHLQPRDSHGTDFSRIRNWTLNGWSKYYRQTLLFSSGALPEINSIFNKRCFNYAGAVKVCNPVSRCSIVNVRVQLPQVYRRFSTDSFSSCINDRFDFFVNQLLPQYKDPIMKQCLVYVPSYFDYVKIRNYFKKEDISFVQICEYSKDGKVARARDMFFHGDAHFLLYSERYHFFHRIRIKGIRHIVFYQPPTMPHFYSEMCNLMQEANQNKRCGSMSNTSVTVLYSKYDLHTLAAVVGSDRTARMISSDKNFHMFTSSDSSS